MMRASLSTPEHKRELPEAKRVAHDKKLGVGAFLFQLLQEFDELGGVIAMLQLTVATHVQVTDKVILLCQSMISLSDREKYPTAGHTRAQDIAPAGLM